MSLVVIRKRDITITERDVEIVRMFSNGGTAKTAAKKMKISPRTIENIISNLKEIFGCKTITELACKFLREKIVE